MPSHPQHPDHAATAAPPPPQGRAPRRPAGAAWLLWVAVGLAACAVTGWTLLGVLLEVTARFDDDADWDMPAAVALAGVLVGLVTGVVASVVSLCSRRLGGRGAAALTGLWVATAALALGGYALSLEAFWGGGFLVAGLQVVVGLLALVALVAVALGRVGVVAR